MHLQRLAKNLCTYKSHGHLTARGDTLSRDTSLKGGGTYLSRTQKLFSKVSSAKMVGYRAMKHVSFSRQLPFLSFLLSFCSDTPDILTIAAQASLICPHDDAAVVTTKHTPAVKEWIG